MTKRVMVASRAVRRGRRLKTRTSMAPPTDPSRGEAIVDEASQDRLAEEQDRLAEEAPESGEGLVGELRDEEGDDEEGAHRISGYSRPPAPAFDFAAPSSSLDDPAEQADEEGDDRETARVAVDFDESEEEPPVDTPITRRIVDDEDAEPRDPNATTLVSLRSPERGSTPPPSQIPVEEAAPSSERLGASDDPEAGFLPEEEEPPLSTPPEATDDALAIGHRNEDASLAPVVDDLDALPSEAVVFLDRAAERRRRTFRRGVGVVLAAVAIGSLALVVGSALTGEEEEAQASAKVDVPAAEKPAEKTNDATKSFLDSTPKDEAAADQTADEAVDVQAGGDYEAITQETLELLNDREFEQARDLAERLVALEPDNAFGYRCLGSALQDLGEVTKAREVYSQCVTKATRGEVAECRALGGAKR